MTSFELCLVSFFRTFSSFKATFLAATFPLLHELQLMLLHVLLLYPFRQARTFLLLSFTSLSPVLFWRDWRWTDQRAFTKSPWAIKNSVQTNGKNAWASCDAMHGRMAVWCMDERCTGRHGLRDMHGWYFRLWAVHGLWWLSNDQDISYTWTPSFYGFHAWPTVVVSQGKAV